MKMPAAAVAVVVLNIDILLYLTFNLYLIKSALALFVLVSGGLGGTTGSASDSRSEGRGFDSH